MLVKMRGSITGHETSLKFGDVVDVDHAHGEAWVAEGLAEAHDATASDSPIVWPRADAQPEPEAEAAPEPPAVDTPLAADALKVDDAPKVDGAEPA